MPRKVTGGASSAVASSSHSACERFRGTDPLITGVSRRKLADEVGASKGAQGTIPTLRWMRAMAFERLVRDRKFASRVVTVAVGALGLARPTAVAISDAHTSFDTTARLFLQAHNEALANSTATLIHQLAIPFIGMESDDDATGTRPDFAVVAPKIPEPNGDADGSWLIVGDAKDYQRIRSKIDDGRLLKGFLQVALGAESASAWSRLPPGMDVHTYGILAVPLNGTLSPTALVEDITHHREEVRLRAEERSAEIAAFPDDIDNDLTQHLSHLKAKYSPDTCPGCDMYVYCRAELHRSTNPTDLLIELGVKPEMRTAAVGLIDGTSPVGKLPRSVEDQIKATLTGHGVASGQRRLDPIGNPGTVNLVLAKSDGATLGLYGMSVQRVTANQTLPWRTEVFTDPDADATRRAVMKVLSQELNLAIAEQTEANPNEPAPVHIVVPDSTTADLLVSIADSIAGKELSRLRWEQDQREGRRALTFNGEEAVIPPRLPERDRAAVSFLLEQDRNRTMRSRTPIVDIRATLASLVTGGGPAVSSLRLDYLTAWADATNAPVDHRSLASLVENSEHSVGAQLTPKQSDAIHAAFAGDKPGLTRPVDPATYDALVRSELRYKTDVFDQAVAALQTHFTLSNLRDAVEVVESDAQQVWRRRLALHAFDLVRFSRTSRGWRNGLVGLLEKDDQFATQVAALTNPVRALDMAQDAGNRRMAIARVVSTDPILLEVDSRRIGHESRIVLLHVNGAGCVEGAAVSVQTQKGSFKIAGMSVGELSTHTAEPHVFRWAPHNVPVLSVGDELVIADFAWFSNNKGDAFLNLPRPSTDTSWAPTSTCTADSYAMDPANHRWCCRSHEDAEAEWSDELAARRARGELNPEVWPPVIDSDAFDVTPASEQLPDPSAEPGQTPPDELTMDDLD